MKITLNLFFYLLLLNISWSQNLVPNPSFEKVPKLVSQWSGTFSKFHKAMHHWTSPTQGSPDVLFDKNLGKMFPPRANVDLTKHSPRSGHFMMGIKTFGCSMSNTLHCREYLQVKLLEPLVPGEEYVFSYWVNPIATSVKVNNFGFAAIAERLSEFNVTGLLDIYPDVASEELIDGEPNDWKRISGRFDVMDTCTHILIGVFYEDEQLEYKIEKEGIDYGYYLLDDVSVELLHPKKKIEKLEVGKTVTLHDITFDFAKATLQVTSFPVLDEVVALLQKDSTISIEIRGHTDNVGNEDYNKTLSHDRAMAVKNYLSEKGILENRVTAKGYGSQYPVVDNETEENRQANRRVECRVL